MARRPRMFAPGLLYHVIVRGNHRHKTFRMRRDYDAYLERLGRYCRKHKVSLHAYCLMPNHVHLLLECSRTPLAKFMQGLQQSYTQYFNLSHHKVGHLFQGRYKAIICERDEYLLELVRYIHLNPVRAKLVRSVEQYPYSGHHCYMAGKSSEMMDPTAVLKLFGGVKAYRRFVQDGLADGHREDYYEVEDQRFLGAAGFGERMRAEVEEESERRVKKKPLEKVLEGLARQMKVSTEALRGPDRSWRVSRARILVAYVLVREGGYGVAELASYFGRDQTTISSSISRFSEKARREPEVLEEAERLERLLR